jgi:ectoine hydroxylase-related dioxygenase (phytanoyl-CoA dioxygenase family)
MIFNFIKLTYIKLKNSLKILLSSIFFKKKKKFKNEQTKNFKKNGYILIKNYLTKKECKIIINQINSAFKITKNIYTSPDKADKRIFGAEYISKNIKKFFNDKYSHILCENYLNYPIINGSTMAGYLKSKKKNKGSGNGWHRDDINKTVKAMVYLSDVSIHNGYFELIKDSNKFFNILRDHNHIKQDLTDIRFDNNRILKLFRFYSKKNLIKFTAKAGSLILFDPSNLHRGHPIYKSSRYVLTNYFFNKFFFNVDLAIPNKRLKNKLHI